jgi:hypothetical protein
MKAVQAHLESLNLDDLRQWTFKGNLPVPTDERGSMNESSPGAFGILELKSPAAVDFHSKVQKIQLLEARRFDFVCLLFSRKTHGKEYKIY